MKYSISIVVASLLFLPVITLAGSGDGFTPLIGIPGLEDQTNFNSYVNALYALSISIAALIAVIQIVIAGAEYMLSDLVTKKSDAKERIRNSLIGLLIIIGAVVILTTVNSDLTNMSVNAPVLNVDDVRAPTTPAELEKEMALCLDETKSGGCVFYSCPALFDNLVSYAATGCALGGTAGALSGAVAGTAVPILGNIWGFISGLGVGCVGGALTGVLVGKTYDVTTCRAGCGFAGGTYIEEGSRTGQCMVPKNSELYTKAEIEAALQALKEEYNCTAPGDRFITSGSGNHRCIKALTSDERDAVSGSLGNNLSDAEKANILDRIQSFGLMNEIVLDNSIKNALQNDLDAEEIILAIEVSGDSLDPRRQEIDGQITGLCDGLDGDYGTTISNVGSRTYIVCGR
jgi:hypothetical protein